VLRLVLTLLQVAGAGSGDPGGGSAGDEWVTLDREIAQLSASLPAQDQPGPLLSGFLRVDQAWTDTPGAPTEFGTSIANARIAFTGKVGEIAYKLSFDGATGSNGTSATIEDAFAIVPLSEDVRLQFGRFFAPLLFSATVGNDRQVFWDRTFQGQTWEGRDAGVQLLGEFGHVRAWALAQNGGDGVADDLLWNVTAAWDLDVDRRLGDQEGGYGVDVPLAVTAAVGYLDEGTIGQGGVIDGQLLATFGAFYLQGEVVSYADGYTPNAVPGGIANPAAQDDLGGSTGWDITASYQFSEHWEAALRFQDVGVDDTRIYSIGVNWFVAGWAVQWLADYNHIASADPTREQDQVLVGLVVGF
jgi:hypothetical protein